MVLRVYLHRDTTLLPRVVKAYLSREKIHLHLMVMVHLPKESDLLLMEGPVPLLRVRMQRLGVT